ncbi:MAG: hypothetical protein AB1490_22490 [Pseudomonadota bacterium]
MLKIAVAAALIIAIGTGSAIAGITLTHAAFVRASAANGKLIEGQRAEIEALHRRSQALLMNLQQRTQMADVQVAKRG